MIDLATCPPARTHSPANIPPANEEAPPPSLGLPPELLKRPGESDRATTAHAPDSNDPLLALEAKELLANFAATGAQQPFEEIVRRYGGMVFNVCLEVTSNRHDAEDATQAAFLSLAIQARSGQQVIAIGPWLQQVARRMSLDINRSRKRRKNREDRHSKNWETRKIDTHDTVSGAANGAPPETAAKWDEMRGIINEELSQLPAKYRMPLILHYYGGMSREEMARELGCRTNTLGVRLHRAREMLGKRLAKRGVEMSGVVIGLCLVEVVRSTVTGHMVASTAQAAALLTAGKAGMASSLVSASVVELAQTAGKVVATAKFKLAAMFALVAGAAAAAGSEVMNHFHIDLPQTIKNLDLGRIFKPFWRTNAPLPQAPTHSPLNRISQGTGDESTTGAIARDTNPPKVIEAPALVTRIPPRAASGSWPWPPVEAPRLQQLAINNTNPPTLAHRGALTPTPSHAPQNQNTGVARSIDAGLRGPSGGGGGGSRGRGATDDSTQVNEDATPKPRSTRDPRPEKEHANREPREKREPRTPQKLPWEDPDRYAHDKKHTENPLPGPGGVKQPPGQQHVDNTPPPSRNDPPPVPGRNPFGNISTPLPMPVPVPRVYPPSTPAGELEDGVDDNAPLTPNGGVIDPETQRLLISSGFTSDGQPPAVDTVIAGGKSQAVFEQSSGHVDSRDVIVGFEGAGAILQSGGVHTLDSLALGATSDSTGLAQIGGGKLLVNRPGADTTRVIEIGGAGRGELRLGNAHLTATIGETGDGSGPVHMVLASTRAARGSLIGWGNVQLTGDLVNNGKVIADGHGKARTLDLTSFARLANDHDNRTFADARGWYAQAGGKLTLPTVAVRASSTPVSYNWGEAAHDDSIDLVNSARVTLGGVDKPARLNISLLATDREDLPTLPAGHTFIGAWSFDLSPDDGGADPTITGGVHLQVRYDHQLADALGLDENVLKLWTYSQDQGGWIRHDGDASFLRDPTIHTLMAHVDGDFTHFAVSAPEPGAIGLSFIALSHALTRRRRRRRS